MRLPPLVARNLVLTVICIGICTAVGFVAGTFVGGVRSMSAMKYSLGLQSYVGTSDFKEFTAVRDGVTQFAAWCGLACAQVVFIVHQFGGGGRGRDERTGGFPVKEI